jgi:PAS domain S-box-containing protein
MQAINYGIYDWDIDAGTVFYAPGLHDMLGLTKEELQTPEDWVGRIHPDDRPHYQAALVAHLRGESPRFYSEYRYRTHDDSWRWARQHGMAVRGADGRAQRVVGATSDITEIKQREGELHSARAAVAEAHRDVEQTR